MVDFQKGQTITFANNYPDAQRAGGWGHARNFLRGHSAQVTTVRRNTITVRVENPNGDYGESKYLSYNVPRSVLEAPNGEAWNEEEKPKPRKIGEVPEGGISPDDPGLAWLWEDAAKVASNSGYCGLYDDIVDKLNIPGRMRDIRISLKIDGVTIDAIVKARSRKEAEAKIKEKLKIA